MNQERQPQVLEGVKQKENPSSKSRRKLLMYGLYFLASAGTTAAIPWAAKKSEKNYTKKMRAEQQQAYLEIQKVNETKVSLSEELLGISALTQAQEEGRISLNLGFDLEKGGKLTFKDLEGKEQEIGSYNPAKKLEGNEKSKPVNWKNFTHLSLNLRGEERHNFIQRSKEFLDEVDRQNAEGQMLIINISATYPDGMKYLVEELAKRGYAHFGINQHGKQTYFKDEINSTTGTNTEIQIGSSVFAHQSLLGEMDVQATAIPSCSGRNHFTETILRSEGDKGKKEILENVVKFINNGTLLISGVVALPNGQKKLLINGAFYIAHDSTSEERLTDLLAIAKTISEIAAKYGIPEEDVVIIAAGDTNSTGFFANRYRVGNVQAIERQVMSLNPKLPEKTAIKVKNLVKKLFGVAREPLNLLIEAQLQNIFKAREDDFQSEILAEFGKNVGLHFKNNGNTFTGSNTDSPWMSAFVESLDLRSMHRMRNYNYETYRAVLKRPDITDHDLVKYFMDLTKKVETETSQAKEDSRPFPARLEKAQQELRQAKEWTAIKYTLATFLISFGVVIGKNLVALKDYVTDYSSTTPSQEETRHQYETPLNPTKR